MLLCKKICLRGQEFGQGAFRFSATFAGLRPVFGYISGGERPEGAALELLAFSELPALDGSLVFLHLVLLRSLEKVLY